MKRKNIRFIIVFLIMILLPPVTWPVVAKVSDFKNISNSDEQKLPILSRDTYYTYTEQLEEYIDDKMPYKDILVTCNGIIDYFVFKVSSSERVVIGNEGWLFYRGSMADYERTNLYSKEELELRCSNLVEIDEYLKKRNIEFVIFIAPNKATIYGDDFLPNYISVNKQDISRTEQLVDYMRENSDIKIVFPKDEMECAYESRPDELFYFKKDTHWNNLGGYYGAKVLLEEFGVYLPDRENLQIQDIECPPYMWNSYDMANMLGMTNVLNTDVNYNVQGCLNNEISYEQDIFADKEAFSTFWRASSTTSNGQKLFLIRDSFGGGMFSYLADSFAEVYSPHVDYMSLDLLEQEKPDIVVLEFVERTDSLSFSIAEWNN